LGLVKNNEKMMVIKTIGMLTTLGMKRESISCWRMPIDFTFGH